VLRLLPSLGRVRTLLVDNYDSFTTNLFHLLARVNGVEPTVMKNDDDRLASVDLSTFDNVVVSPGPGRPDRPGDVGHAARLVREAALPVLGVCLGHQLICHVHGGVVEPAVVAMHGRLSTVEHDDDALFFGIPNGFTAVRYHSLAATSLSEDLQNIARTGDGVVMAVRHRTLPLWGVQFHPESIATEHGARLLANFRDLSTAWNAANGRYAVEPAHEMVTPCSVVAPAETAFVIRHRTILDWVEPDVVFSELFAESEPAFWLDSAQVSDSTRFSYMGDASGPFAEKVRYDVHEDTVHSSSPGGEATVAGSVYSYVQNRMREIHVDTSDLPFSFTLGYVGSLGYELKAESGVANRHRAPTPDALLLFVDRMVVFDHQDEAIHLVAMDLPQSAGRADAWLHEMQERLRDADRGRQTEQHVGPLHEVVDDDHVDLRHSRDEYLELIAACQEQIRQGESYEICLTNMLRFPELQDPLSTYLHLRRVNAAPYASYFRFAECSILSASPERFLRVYADRRIETRPVKGTARRGTTAVEDAAIAAALRDGEKERAENLMIVDLLRNDLGLVSEIGSVSAPHLFTVETLPTVHQLVSTVVGTLRADKTAIDCLRAAFPGGSMTGAPKIRTMEILDDLENGWRGIYSGAIGYLSLDGQADWSIVIRTIVAMPGAAFVGTGGAITSLSDPVAEFDETMLKARALRHAVAATRVHEVST
jgi:para-aminobenzoate synthetase